MATDLDIDDVAAQSQKAKRELDELRAALKRANDQAEHFERLWYLRGDEIEAALPAMREFARKNPVHHFGDGPQDPCGVHAWLERNDPPNAKLSGGPAERTE